MCILISFTIAFASGITTDFVLREHLHGYPHIPAGLLLSITVCSTLLMTFNDDPFAIAKGLLLAEMMIVISLCDGLTHRIPNVLLLPVLTAGFINFDPFSSILGLFAVSLPILLISALTKGGIGNGDIKLMAAIGFALGSLPAIGGTILGLIVSLPFELISRHHNRKSEPYALAPWLCSGCFLAYLLNH